MRRFAQLFLLILLFLSLFLLSPQEVLAEACSGDLFQATISPNPVPETSSSVNISISPLNDRFDSSKTYKIQLILAGTVLFERDGLTVSSPDGPLQLTITPGDFLDLFYYHFISKDGYELKVLANSDTICSGIKIATIKPSCSLTAWFNSATSIQARVSNYNGRDTSGLYGPHILIQRQTGCPPIIGCSIVTHSINIRNRSGSVVIDTGDVAVGTEYRIVLTTAGNLTNESCGTTVSKPLTSPTPPDTPTPAPTGPAGEYDPCWPGKPDTPQPPDYDKCHKCDIGTTLGEPGSWTALGCIPNDPRDFVAWLLARAIGIGGGIAFLLMIWGGFQVITAAGDPDRLNAGKEIITSAIAGLLLIIFSLFLLELIGVDILGLKEVGFEFGGG